MIPLRTIFEKERKRLKVPWIVLEQDYLLSWILWGIQSVDILKRTLVFKGGTALKKIYFDNYRFSEDLDFSVLKGVPMGEDLFTSLKQACITAQKAMEEQIPNPIITCTPYEGKHPHPGNQQAFTIKGQLPWHREPHVRVMVEITMDEIISLNPLEKPILSHWYESMAPTILSYSLEEIISEKLRAILQNIKKYHERGWIRSRARDYYDLWCILKQKKYPLNLKLIPKSLEEKSKPKNVSYQSIDDFFDTSIISQVKTDWQQWLAPLISDLPVCDMVLDELYEALSVIIPTKL